MKNISKASGDTKHFLIDIRQAEFDQRRKDYFQRTDDRAPVFIRDSKRITGKSKFRH